MSAFSQAFTQLTDREFGGVSAGLASALGIPRSTCTRWKLGQVRPDADGLRILVERLPREQVQPLIRAYIDDLLPAQAAGWLEWTGSMEESSPPWIISRLDDECRWALERLAQAALDSEDARGALIAAARYITPDRAK